MAKSTTLADSHIADQNPGLARGFIISLRFSIHPSRYKSSTFLRAQGVLRRNFRLDEMLGSLVKQCIVILFPSSSHPYCSTRCSRIICSVFPYRGSFGCSSMGLVYASQKSAQWKQKQPAQRVTGLTLLRAVAQTVASRADLDGDVTGSRSFA